MSDSDETVCGNESGEDNTENSPSILIHWRQDKTVFSTEKDEKSLKKRSDKERKKQRYKMLTLLYHSKTFLPVEVEEN